MTLIYMHSRDHTSYDAYHILRSRTFLRPIFFICGITLHLGEFLDFDWCTDCLYHCAIWIQYSSTVKPALDATKIFNETWP